MTKRAKENKQRVVLAEGAEDRTIKAADIILSEGIADIILIGSKKEIEDKAAQFGLKNIGKATIVDPSTDPRMGTYSNLLYELRKKKGMTPRRGSEDCLRSIVSRMSDDQERRCRRRSSRSHECNRKRTSSSLSDYQDQAGHLGCIRSLHHVYTDSRIWR